MKYQSISEQTRARWEERQAAERKDAEDLERYRWLRDRHNDPASYLCVTNGPEDLIIEHTVDIDGLDIEGLDLDAAIDAARAQEKGDAPT